MADSVSEGGEFIVQTRYSPQTCRLVVVSVKIFDKGELSEEPQLFFHVPITLKILHLTVSFSGGVNMMQPAGDCI